ncbi:aminotransferase-like domain-containing protein [Vibrio nereis]|uniref:Transcriptional regulator n=1 Tax=Vibrio nereis TaxID=693 RepID=A0A0M0HQC6_VIBNE|nr:PLP-dependent aminotransferase family protein [Vibrio nereis]KOO04325.1 transcriptional regulator [Vibrio nereis]
MGTDKAQDTVSKFHYVESTLKQAITEGVYELNDKLPSIRQLSLELKVSKNTVIRAFQELEAQGVVYSVPRSGYRVSSGTMISPPIVKPLRVDLLSVCKEFLTYPQYKELLPLGSAHPNIDAPAIKSLYAEIGRHSRRQTHTPSHYQLPPGDSLLVRQLAKITQDLGTPASPNELLVTHGAQQAISLALRATTQPGDIVAVESPCYFGNLLLLESLGLEVIEIPSCHRDGMDPQALREALEQWEIKVIILTPNFTNPTGSMMPLERRKAILDMSGKTPIIEDDVFGALSYAEPIPSLKSLDKADRVIYVNSLSKTLDSRLRIGWMLAGKHTEHIERLLLCDSMGGINLMQSALSDFFTSGKYKTHLSRMRRIYQSNTKRFVALFKQAMEQYPSLHNHYHISGVQGSFLLWIRLPESIDCDALYRTCSQHKISILPGSVFGTQSQFKHCFRVCVANFTNEKDWSNAINRLAKILAGFLL